MYKEIIKNMRWSYSRINSFINCPYGWYLKYLSEEDSMDKFYASYGSFVHRILEDYYDGFLEKEELVFEFLNRFKEEVRGERPALLTVEKYIKAGVKYFREFSPFDYETIAVEDKLVFSIKDKNFVGYVDYIGQNGEEFVIIDNKSKDLSPRSKRKKPTKKDEELDLSLRQLYLYSRGVFEKYKRFPTHLCFNCFKSGVFIKEPFVEDDYNRALQWAMDEIEIIEEEDEFSPNIEYFFCRFLCDVSHECCYVGYK